MKALLMSILLIASLFSAYAKETFVITVEGVITSYTEKYIETAIKKASENDGMLMIKLDTPGGLLSSTRGIVQQLLESETPVIAFVSPQGARAGSAGTFIVLASHYAAMAEGTNIGAAHPVNITGKDIEGHMAEKIENDTVAFIKSIAQKRGRAEQPAVETVTQSKSYTASEALSMGLIDSVSNTDTETAEKAALHLGTELSGLTYIKPTAIQKVAFFLSDPNVLVMLLFIGILAIVLEFKIPGTFVFASLGIAAIFLFLMGINIIPVNSLALLLVILGLGLLGAEIFIPSFGLLTLAGTASLGAGMFLLFSREGNIGISVSLWVIAGVLGIVLCVAVIIGRLIFKDFFAKPKTGKNSMIGETGRISSWEGLSGKIYVHGEYWNAKSDSELEKDDKAVIIHIEGMTVKVEKKSD